MTTLDAYARFITARWDEQEDAARTSTVEVSIHRRWSAVDGQESVEVTPSVDVFTPAYVLADLAAKRAVLALAMNADRESRLVTKQDFIAGCRAGALGLAGPVLDELARPFRDHPDHPANQEAT